LTALIHSN